MTSLLAFPFGFSALFSSYAACFLSLGQFFSFLSFFMGIYQSMESDVLFFQLTLTIQSISFNVSLEVNKFEKYVNYPCYHANLRFVSHTTQFLCIPRFSSWTLGGTLPWSDRLKTEFTELGSINQSGAVPFTLSHSNCTYSKLEN